MGTYKVLQDIEAEDKFLGPLTLKQFIYGGVAIVCLYLSFVAITKGAAFVAIIFLPFIVVAGFFAWPFTRDQPTEIWALAKIRFMLKPRRRIWDQSGIVELVTITAPKRLEKILSKNLSRTEVTSRLEALANTIDSRGWAVKNVNVNLYGQPAFADDESDRLVAPSSTMQNPLDIDIKDTDDILDETTSATAQNFDKMIASSSIVHKQQAVAQMQQATTTQTTTNSGTVMPAPDYWFLRGEPTAPTNLPAGMSSFQKSQVVMPGAADASSATKTTPITADDQALLQKIHTDQSKPNPAYGHMRTIQPVSKQTAPVTPQLEPPKSTTPDPALIELAVNNDLDVATIARQADKSTKKDLPNNEVVISLR